MAWAAVTEPVMAATAWPSNAHLIADCARLEYLRYEDEILDPTWGRGTWWKIWEPVPFRLVRHDLYTLDGIDFRQLPHEDRCFDAVTFDPPYVCTGGRDTTTMPDFADRYGLTNAPRTPAALQEMNNAGLKEMLRVVKPKGIVLVKCADYVWSGKLVIGTHRTLTAALDLGFSLEDRLEHIGRPRPQPPRTRADGEPVRQHHARRNLSTLLVLRAPRG
jgi:DNA modification methylase